MNAFFANGGNFLFYDVRRLGLGNLGIISLKLFSQLTYPPVDAIQRIEVYDTRKKQLGPTMTTHGIL